MAIINIIEKDSFTIGNEIVTSAAQAITLIAYGDSSDARTAKVPFRSLSYRTQCRNFADFASCLKIIGNYGKFNPNSMMAELNKYLNLKKYFNPDNPNNGYSFFNFEIAREGSPAFYISFNPEQDNTIMIGNVLMPYSVEGFRECMADLKILIKAEEMDITENYGSYTARFWFD